ncbi:alpha-(1,3)-fucosyltransferase C-like [Argopecten irradians]|uniref:alpha-(1,3)-fucosyltransferase C-like n=1 Tax=Argopecten irradians TaxID=31199 RepID=UPI00371D9D2E
MTFGQYLTSRSIFGTICFLSLLTLGTLYTQLYKTSIIVESTTIKPPVVEDFRSGNNEETSPSKIILSFSHSRWIKEWVGQRWGTSDVFQSCPSSKDCILTKDKSLINKADAVIYNWLTTCKLRKRHKKGQVWILFEFESPDYYASYSNKNCWRNDVVNWTFTYRRDSDFSLVHGKFVPHHTGYKLRDNYQLLRGKTKTAVGFISHCKAPSKRDDFVRMLRKYGVDIDIIGKCGNLKCGGQFESKWKGVWNVTGGHEDHCFDVLDHKYKFYLSLENSLFDDYVTEKSLHLVLRRQIVPLIRDGANRSLYHPPHSYLDTKDFKSVESLAKRLKYISNNFDEYLKYFEWRKHYSIETISGVLQSVYCEMCHRMHHQDLYRRVYRNVEKFYSKSHEKLTYNILNHFPKI